jgi:hypothetical protein
MAIRIGLDDLQRLLHAPVPMGYVDYIKKNTPSRVRSRGFDPKTLCILNLDLRNARNAEQDGWTKDRFFLSGDGCGNYYFVENTPSADATKVLLWAHDPHGIEDPDYTLTYFLQAAPQMDPIKRKVSPDEICIARTQIVGESILNPILLEEWKQAVASCEGIRYLGYRTYTNPITKKKGRSPAPGLAVAKYSGEDITFHFYRGRITAHCVRKPRQLVTKLAKAIHAQFFIGSH